jgi:predicted dehydrogenase
MKLKVGIVGTGSISVESHIPVLKSLENVEVAGICDQQIAIAKEAAIRFGIKNTYSDLSEMLSKEKLDVVDICTPPNTHAPLSIQSMEAGCHVLCEKPMATSVKEADEMTDCSKKSGVKLCVVHQNLCNPVIMKAKELVTTGALGKLLHVELRTYERRDSELCQNKDHWCHRLPGGIFYEIIPHPVYLSQTFLKNPTPIQVVGKKVSDRDWMKNDEIRALLQAESGFGSIVASCNSLIHGDTVDILGSEMELRGDLWGRTLITFQPRDRSSTAIGMSNLNLSLQLFKVVGSTMSTFMKAVRGKASAHYTFISRFIDSIFKDSRPPVTAEEGRETVRLLGLICQQLAS